MPCFESWPPWPLAEVTKTALGFLVLINLLRDFEELLAQPPRCGATHVIAVDGRAGAGKTTLATELFLMLSVKMKVTLIHLDDLYEGWELALGSKLTDSLFKLLESVSAGKGAQVRIYDWVEQKFNTVREIPVSDLLIIEGVGSAQKLVREYSTATVWMEIDPKIGLQRVLDRDGASVQSHMELWQIQEEKHFRDDDTQENADFVLSTLL